MSDEELLYMDMIPSEIRKFIEVEDLEPVSSAIDHFRKSMDKFMFLKNEILGIYEEEKLKSIDKSEELEVNNKALMLCRLETSRRFGIYFMQFFQAAMEATRSSVGVRVKKVLNLSCEDRLEVIDPLIQQVKVFVKDDVVYQNMPYILQHCDENLINKMRKYGFSRNIVNCGNSVTVLKNFNCVICNHKLDPQYVIYLEQYLKWKNSNKLYDDEDNDIFIVNGVAIPVENPSSSENDDICKSPHTNIWPARNQWYVKDKLLVNYYAKMNRYKQEMLLNAHRAEVDYCCK